MNAEHDKGKSNRNYTDTAIKKRLIAYLLWMISVSLIGLYVYHPAICLLVASFIVLNHLLYHWFVHRKAFADFLPLLKYPFIVLIFSHPDFTLFHLSKTQIVSAVSIIFSMIAFESMDDRSFIIQLKYAPILQTLSFLPLYILNQEIIGVILISGILLMSIIITTLKLRGFQYIFLFFLLSTKLVMDM